MPLLLCQRQPYLQLCEAKVLSCEPTKTPEQPPDAKKKKKKKKKKGQSNAAPVLKTFDVKLSDSVCFATGGGQPNDLGTIGDANVVDVFRDEKGEVIHRVLTPVSVGETLPVKIDWQRRYDHMQQHTGQHLISAIFRTHGHETVSWNLSKYPEPCFVMLDHAKTLNLDKLLKVEQEVNRLIRAATPHELVIIEDMEEAKQHPYFATHPDKMAHVEGGAVRMMNINGVDFKEFNMCCGTHLKSLGELQMVKLSHLGSDGKVEFLAGSRLTDALTRSLHTSKQLKDLLSCGTSQFADTVARTLTERKQAVKKIQHLEKELADLVAKQMYSRFVSPEGELLYENKVCTLHRPGASLAFLKTIATGYKELWPESQAKGTLVLTASSTFVRDVESKDGVFVIVGPASKHGKLFCTAVQGSGGGRGLFQGKARDLTADSRLAGLDALMKAAQA